MALRRTCRRLRVIVNSRTSKIKLDPSVDVDASSLQLSTRFPSLEHLDFMKPGAVDGLTDQLVAQLSLQDLNGLRHLTSINLENCTALNLAGLASLVLGCRHLTAVTLPQICQSCMTPAVLLPLAQLPSLNRLRFKTHRNATEALLTHATGLTSLTSLEVEDMGRALRGAGTALRGLTNLRAITFWSDTGFSLLDLLHELNLQDDFPDDEDLNHHHHHPQGHNHVHQHAHQHAQHQHQNGHNGQWPGQQQAAAPPGGAQQQQQQNPMMVMLMALPNQVPDAEAAAAAGMGMGVFPQQGPAGAAAVLAAAAAAAAAPQQQAAAPAPPDAAPVAVAVVDEHSALQAMEQLFSAAMGGGPRSAMLGLVTSLPSLTHLDVQRVDIANGAELARFAALPSLQHLGLGDLDLTSAPPTSLALAGVTKLVVHGVRGAEHLPATFPDLRALSCDACDSTMEVLAGMTALVNLFLWQPAGPAYEQLTDEGLAAVSELTALDEFRLEGCGSVTDAGWQRFTSRHTRLTKVDLVRCPSLSAVGLVKAARHMGRLRGLNLAECPGVDATALAAFIALCPDLEEITVTDCRAIKQSGVSSVLEGLASTSPDLAIAWSKGGARRVHHATHARPGTGRRE